MACLLEQVVTKPKKAPAKAPKKAEKSKESETKVSSANSLIASLTEANKKIDELTERNKALEAQIADPSQVAPPAGDSKEPGDADKKRENETVCSTRAKVS